MFRRVKGAITFGDLNDPASPVRKILENEATIQRKPSLGTYPTFIISFKEGRYD